MKPNLKSSKSDNSATPPKSTLSLNTTPRLSTRRGRKCAGVPIKKLFPTPNRANLIKRGTRSFSLSGVTGEKPKSVRKGAAGEVADPDSEGQLLTTNKRKRMGDNKEQE